MKVYLVQHGEAVAKEVDPERPLSEQGQTDVRKVGAFLAATGLRAGRIVHSGKTRAAQTAKHLAQALGPDLEPEAVEGLNPKDSGEHLVAEIEATPGDLLVAGHQPFMGRFASRLLTGSEDGMSIAFKPASVACLEEGDDGGWSLQWMIRPELIS